MGVDIFFILAKRNDQFSIVNIPFETKQFDDVPVEKPDMFNDVQQWINPALMLIAIIASLLLLKGIMKSLKSEKIMIGTFNNDELAFDTLPRPELAREPAVPQFGFKPKNNFLPIGDLEDEISDEAAMKRTQQQKISNYVSKNPLDAAKLINAWLHEDEF